jgi:hypothetical protein
MFRERRPHQWRSGTCPAGAQKVRQPLRRARAARSRGEFVSLSSRRVDKGELAGAFQPGQRGAVLGPERAHHPVFAWEGSHRTRLVVAFYGGHNLLSDTRDLTPLRRGVFSFARDQADRTQSDAVAPGGISANPWGLAVSVNQGRAPPRLPEAASPIINPPVRGLYRSETPRDGIGTGSNGPTGRYAPPLENLPTCDRATASLRLHLGKSEDAST